MRNVCRSTEPQFHRAICKGDRRALGVRSIGPNEGRPQRAEYRTPRRRAVKGSNFRTARAQCFLSVLGVFHSRVSVGPPPSLKWKLGRKRDDIINTEGPRGGTVFRKRGSPASRTRFLLLPALSLSFLSTGVVTVLPIEFPLSATLG